MYQGPLLTLLQPHWALPSFFLFVRFYLCIFREREREKQRERNINVWWPLERPLLGTWVENQACDLIGNRPGDPLVHR